MNWYEKFFNKHKSPNGSMQLSKGKFYQVKHPKRKPTLFWNSRVEGTLTRKD